MLETLERMVSLNQPSDNSDDIILPATTVSLLDIFVANENIPPLILSQLGYNDLIILSCTYFNLLEEVYFKDDKVWKGLLSEIFFVDRILNYKSFSESFKIIQNRWLRKRNLKLDDEYMSDFILSELRKVMIAKENSNLHNILNLFW